jgi:ABC-type bacteriocin/lantibiotic exporter with double-glycine peptidase domain
MEAVECGAAALAMVLAYHGAWVPLEQLRLECGVSRDGSKASNIVKAARRFGLAAKGFRKEPSTLHELPMPCIIHWNFNHFVVLEGIEGDRVYINDPAIGRRRIDMAELDLAFTGVVLAMEKTEAFRKLGRKPQGLRLLLRELGRSKEAVALLIIVSFALIVPSIVAAGFSKIFVDDILIKHADDWLAPLLIGMAVTALFRAILTILRQSLLLRLQTKLAVVMISRFLWHVMALPVEFFTQRHSGDIANRVAANEQIARLLSSGIAANALNLTSILVFAAAMAIYDVPLAAIGVGLSLLNVLASAGSQSRSCARTRQACRRHGERRTNHRNTESERARGRSVRPVGGNSSQGLELGAGARSIRYPPRNAADVTLRIDGRRDPRHRRLTRDRGLPHTR